MRYLWHRASASTSSELGGAVGLDRAALLVPGIGEYAAARDSGSVFRLCGDGSRRDTGGLAGSGSRQSPR